MMPNHPVFLYIGRNLADPRFQLPKLPDGPFLFKRNYSGDMTDYGYGPGVEVADEFQEEAAEEESVALKHYLGYVAKMEGYA